jgi:hypothetical protein
VDLQPYGAPIFIPSSGGSFDYDITVENIVDSTIAIDVWIEVDTPSGSTISPLILRTDNVLAPGESVMRTLTQEVPAAAPSGYYVYRAVGGDYPGTEYDYDSFNFGKLADDGSPGSNIFDWSLYGWDSESLNATAPAEFELRPAYPNPFNPETQMTFYLPRASRVNLTIYDLSGRRVATLYDGWYNAGVYQATFGAEDLPSGMYLARFQVDGFTQTQKLILMK